MKLTTFSTLTLVLLSGCAKSLDPLVCQVLNAQSTEAIGEHKSSFFPTGFRYKLTFLDNDQKKIAIGDVFGSRDVLQQTPIVLKNGLQLDPNVSQYENVKEKPPKFEKLLLLNRVSGQMYYHALLDGKVSDTFYAHCMSNNSTNLATK